MLFTVESPPPGSVIDIFQYKLGIMVENITSDSRRGFADVTVMAAAQI